MIIRNSTALAALLLLAACNTTQLTGALKNTVTATRDAQAVVEDGSGDYIKALIISTRPSTPPLSTMLDSGFICGQDLSLRDAVLSNLYVFEQTMSTASAISSPPTADSWAAYVKKIKENSSHEAPKNIAGKGTIYFDTSSKEQKAKRTEAVSRCKRLYLADSSAKITDIRRPSRDQWSFVTPSVLLALNEAILNVVKVSEVVQREAETKKFIKESIPTLREAIGNLKKTPGGPLQQYKLNYDDVAETTEETKEAKRIALDEQTNILGTVISNRRWIVAQTIDAQLTILDTCTKKCLGDDYAQRSIDSLVSNMNSYRALSSFNSKTMLNEVESSLTKIESNLNGSIALPELVDQLMNIASAINGMSDDFDKFKKARLEFQKED